MCSMCGACEFEWRAYDDQPAGWRRVDKCLEAISLDSKVTLPLVETSAQNNITNSNHTRNTAVGYPNLTYKCLFPYTLVPSEE